MNLGTRTTSTSLAVASRHGGTHLLAARGCGVRAACLAAGGTLWATGPSLSGGTQARRVKGQRGSGARRKRYVRAGVLTSLLSVSPVRSKHEELKEKWVQKWCCPLHRVMPASSSPSPGTHSPGTHSPAPIVLAPTAGRQ